MCTLNGCPSTLLLNPRCWGTSSRCTYLLDDAGGIRFAQTAVLLSGDAFSVFSTIRMVRAWLAKVCESKRRLCEKSCAVHFVSRIPPCVETSHWGVSRSITSFGGYAVHEGDAPLGRLYAGCRVQASVRLRLLGSEVLRLWGLCSIFRVQSTTTMRNACQRASKRSSQTISSTRLLVYSSTIYEIWQNFVDTFFNIC